MELYCIINGKRYNIVSGATFSEEYNETLDSGSIIIDHVDKMDDLEPYDDVYIYDVVEQNQEHSFYKHMLIDTFQEELENVSKKFYKYKINLFSEIKKLEKVICPNISITQPVDKTARRSVYDYLEAYLDLYSPQIKVATNSENWKYEKKYNLSNNKNSNLPAEYKEVLYLESDGNQIINTDVMFSSGYRFTGSLEFEYVEAKDNSWIFGSLTSNYEGIEAGIYHYEDEDDKTHYYFYNKKEVTYSQKSALTMRTVANFDTFDLRASEKKFYLFTRIVGNNFEGGNAKCKIYHFVLKRDDVVECELIPCIRKSDSKPGMYDTVRNIFLTNSGSGEFTYKEFTYSYYDHESVKEKFSDVDAPEMSLTNPTLRDILSQLMLVKDCIPVVNDDVIDFIDVSERHGTFFVEEDCVNYIHSSMTSADFSTEARREYSGALSQDNTAKMVEYLGFRNSNSPLLTLENLVLETRFPIYKINKMYLCYYKRAETEIADTYATKKPYYMCKHDITKLVVQNVVRQSLSQDYKKFEELESISKNEASKWKILTVGYDIGSNKITGWDEKYTFYNSPIAWFQKTHTVLENIICMLDYNEPFGEKNIYNIIDDVEKEYVTNPGGQGELSSIQTGDLYIHKDSGGRENYSVRQKAVFFQIEYDAMFNGALVHSKDFKEKDDLMTADNCSSSLTVLEVDGLFEKEKMNRLGNRQYNIQARYDSNGNSSAYYKMNNTYNHILGSAYDDDVIIYHREYQIYNDFILANFAGTYDYVLKNYFTSVFAKLRTYNLASYGESTVRAENYKEYVVLSDDKATYETETLLYPYLERYISCFNLTEVPEIVHNESKINQINFAYIQSKTIGTSLEINKSRAFSDVNAFCSGSSLCINLKMYDNVTQGVYIKEALTSEETEENAVGSVQEWSIAVDNVEDAFQEKMIFGFGHLYQEGDNIPEDKSVFIREKGSETIDVKNIYENRLLLFPNFGSLYYLGNSTEYVISNENNQNNVKIYKDNKEVIDYTFQFETITNSKDIFFSSYFTKLSEMSGVYKKWNFSGTVENILTPNLNDNVIITYHAGTVDVSLKIGIPKEIIDDKFKEFCPFSIKYENFLSPRYFVNSSSHPDLHSITAIQISNVTQNKKISILFNNKTYTYNITEQSYVIHDSYSYNKEYDFEDVYDEDEKYYYFENKIVYTNLLPSNPWYDKDDINVDTNLSFKISSETYNSRTLKSDKMNYTKNMFAIVSDEPIKKEIIYDNYLAKKIRTISDFKLYEEGEYTITEPIINSMEDVIFNIDFISNGQNFKGITFDLNSMWYIRENDSKLRVYYKNGGIGEWVSGESYKTIKIMGGNDLGLYSFKKWLYKSIELNGLLEPKSGIIIPNLPDYMHTINTDDEESEKYIPFENLFSFRKPKTDISGAYKLDNMFLPSGPGKILNVNFSCGRGINRQEFNGILITSVGIRYFKNVPGQETPDSVLVFDRTGWTVQAKLNHYDTINIASGQTLSNEFKSWLESVSSDYVTIPTIRVGNSLLSQYPNHKSIQFWYLDNGGEGGGKLQFVFGVNTTENIKKVYASVMKKRSPYVYSKDHKEIVGKIKQMSNANYEETNKYEEVD